MSTWSGWVYVAFVVDAYARRYPGLALRLASMSTQLVLDAPRAGRVDPATGRSVS